MPIIIFNTINNMTPGNPNIPIKIEVIKFNPIWKLNNVPIKFIPYIRIPPKIEFNINLNILFSGNINILPTIKIKKMHANIVIILFVSKSYSPLYIFYIHYAIIWTNITFLLAYIIFVF